MNEFLCPICKAPLHLVGRSLICEHSHNFDLAKSGYVNLLPPNAKNSKNPGDNKLMVDARKNFLEKGYYTPLCKALCEQALHFCQGNPAPVIVDAGCGEGYYTTQVTEALSQVCKPEVFGVDISKFALNSAAKKNKQIRYAVGSIHHLPIGDRCCDLLLNLFAPYSGKEFLRILKPNGIFIMVIPGENHLLGLKEAVYDTPYKNEVKDYPLEGFSMVNKVVVEENITLTSTEDIENLFLMTPYYYKTSQENRDRLKVLTTLTTPIHFEILIYQKQ